MIFRLPSVSTQRTPRNFSFDRIAARCSAWRSGSRSSCELVLVPRRDDAVVVRELAVDHLRDELDRCRSGSAPGSRDARCATSSSLSASSLASSSTVLRGRITSCARQLAVDARCEAKAGGGRRWRRACSVAAVDHQQHAVQVVADVLLRHRELDQAQQPAQRLLRQREARRFAGRAWQAREIVRRQRLQVEAALAGRTQQALVLRLQR